MRYAIVDTTFGAFGFVTNEGRLLATWLPHPKSTLRRIIAQKFPDAQEDDRALPGFRRDLDAYFNGEPLDFAIDLELGGSTPFQHRVLEACRNIPYGETVSYGQLAEVVGAPRAARAVGAVMASNRIPLVIPCHRVLRSDGSLGGFTSPEGVGLKQRLLDLETEGVAQRASNPKSKRQEQSRGSRGVLAGAC